MDGEGECVLDLTGICAGSLLRECLRQGQSFAPPGDAAEAERGCPGAVPGLAAPTLVAAPGVPFFLLLYNWHIPPQTFFSPLAIYG